MGYRYEASGFIEFKEGISKEQAETLLEESDVPFYYEFYTHQMPPGVGCAVDVRADGNYYEEEYHAALHKLAPYVETSEIYCTGEDNEMWRFTFSADNADDFTEENGVVFYMSQVHAIGRMNYALKAMIKDAEAEVSAAYAAGRCKKLGLTAADMEGLGLEYLADLWDSEA